MADPVAGYSVPKDIAAFEQKIATHLIERAQLTPPNLERALRVKESGEGGRLPHLLSMLGLVPEREVAQALADLLELPLIQNRDFPTVAVLEDRVNRRFLSEFHILPLADDADGVGLAMADPLNEFAIAAMRLRAGKPVLPRVAIPSEVDSAIDRLYGRPTSRRGADGGDSGVETDDAFEHDVERLKDIASEAPVIRLVNQLISRAVESRASDIHLEPSEDGLHVRYRIDGSLREMEPPPGRYRAAIISRIKIMARLNIAERRLPQDGRIKLAIRGTSIDFRIAIIPTLHGESVVIRILDRSSVALDLAPLGMSDADLATYLGVLERPHGILLATGPTGSGKTTTLYASLLRLHAPEKKIVTIEDPIEYQLDGIEQIQVKSGIGLDFANILRSVLRHDPNIIMVGEIRDGETADVAVQAALTGHLVLSTLHTNNAASSITRLLDMGVQDFLLASTLNGAIAQRLVRKLCCHCREPYVPLPELCLQLGLRRYAGSQDITLYRPKGCVECHGTGFFGRTSVFEILVITDAVRRLILQRAEAHDLQRAAVHEGMHSMYDDGMAKAVAGITTIEEVLQVTRDVHVEVTKTGVRLQATSDRNNTAEGLGIDADVQKRVPGAGLGAVDKNHAETSVEEILEILETVEEAILVAERR
ncbi:MAG: GspE/PulE family protein [Hypericibacter sp.]